MAGYVYLIGTPIFNWYKIGKSVTPEIRIKDIGILLPFKVEVFAIWKADNHTLLEAILHEKYAEFRINGEWFGFTKNEVKAVVSRLPDESRIFPKDGNSDPFFASFTNLKIDKITQDLEMTKFYKEQQKALHKLIIARTDELLTERGLEINWPNRRTIINEVNKEFDLLPKTKKRDKNKLSAP